MRGRERPGEKRRVDEQEDEPRPARPEERLAPARVDPQKVGEDVVPVEGGDRREVEDAEEDGDGPEPEQRLRRHPLRQGGRGRQKDDEAEGERRGEGDEKARGAAGQAHEDGVAAPAPEARRVHGNRLRPSEEVEPAGEPARPEQEEDEGREGDQNGADQVDVRARIERHPALEPRRRVAAPVRRPRVRALMDGDDEEEDQIAGGEVEDHCPGGSSPAADGHPGTGPCCPLRARTDPSCHFSTR